MTTYTRGFWIKLLYFQFLAILLKYALKLQKIENIAKYALKITTYYFRTE
jgi:hypothetical protein